MFRSVILGAALSVTMGATGALAQEPLSQDAIAEFFTPEQERANALELAAQDADTLRRFQEDQREIAALRAKYPNLRTDSENPFVDRTPNQSKDSARLAVADAEDLLRNRELMSPVWDFGAPLMKDDFLSADWIQANISHCGAALRKADPLNDVMLATRRLSFSFKEELAQTLVCMAYWEGWHSGLAQNGYPDKSGD